MGFARRLSWVLAAALAVALAAAAVAQGQIAYTPCPHGNELACATLTVPLDPSGATPGTISLALRRHRAPVGEARTAIIALAGGPGQSAIPFVGQFDELLGPVAATRDLIAFDERGAGLSQPLACKALEGQPPSHPAARAVRRCAGELGSQRAFYRSADTVADIEAIRRAGGYEKLVLYGTSYGTKVAELYAQTYPSRVEALVLDSVVTPSGPDTLDRPTFAALPGALRSICEEGACRGVTRDPFADLGHLVARLHDEPLHVAAVGPRGHRREIRVTPEALLELLLAGDFSGPLRAEFVTSVRAADEGDTAPLGRLLALAGQGEPEAFEIDVPLYYATTCEEQSFPFVRAASGAIRLAEARGAAQRLARPVFAPFDATDAIELSDIPVCAAWPNAGPAPAPAAQSLAPVPTLILSGSEDLRTPTSGAREVAAEIPGSHLLVVPYTGHSVLGEDPSSCSADALQALFAGRPVRPCRVSRPPRRLRPPPLPPRRLASLVPTAGTHGLPGQTARAVQLTLTDLSRQLRLHLEASGLEALLLGNGLRVGGLRSGFAWLNGSGVQFHDYSYVPGVRLDGAIKLESARLEVSAPEVAGTLHLGSHRTLVGELDGQAVRLPAVSNGLAAIVGSNAAVGGVDHHLLHPGDAGPQRPLSGGRVGGRAVLPMPR